MREGKEEMKRAIREETREQNKEIKEEIEEIKKRIVEGEEKGRKEKDEVKERIRKVEETIEAWKSGGKGEPTEEEGIAGRIEGRIQKLEKRWDAEEKEKRRGNIVVRGIKGENEGEVEKSMEEALKEREIEAKVEKVKWIKRRNDKREGMALIVINSEEEKREIMRKRRALREKELRIEEDLTWGERRMKWNIENVVWRERGKGRRVWISYGKIQIEGEWWVWDEVERVLKGRGGKNWEEQGEVKEGTVGKG